MATPVFKFQHPDLPDEDLYFIHNTLFELPQTVPVDLFTFLRYHEDIDRSIMGFIAAWQNLNEHGTSLNDVRFNERFTETEKKMLYSDANAALSLDVAFTNKEASQVLKTHLDKGLIEPEKLTELIYELLDSFGHQVQPLRDLDYYNSRHYLAKYLYENNLLQWQDVNALTESALLEIYQNSKFPLFIVPHRFRSNGVFYNLCFLNYEGKSLIPKIHRDISCDLTCVMKVLSVDGLSLEFVDEILKKEPEVVRMAVMQNGLALEFADAQLQGDKALALLALTNNINAIAYVDKNLQNDPAILKLLNGGDC